MRDNRSTVVRIVIRIVSPVQMMHRRIGGQSKHCARNFGDAPRCRIATSEATMRWLVTVIEQQRALKIQNTLMTSKPYRSELRPSKGRAAADLSNPAQLVYNSGW